MNLDLLLPHRRPLRLVRGVVERLDDGIVCWGTIPYESPLAFPDGASPFLGIELAAQSAGVYAGLRNAEEADGEPDEPGVGYLAAIRKAEISVPLLPLDEPLWAEVRDAGAMATLSMFRISVRRAEAEETLLTATLSTMVAPS